MDFKLVDYLKREKELDISNKSFFMCRKHSIEYLNNEKYGVENMIINGYDRIYDCGNKVFVKSYIE